MDTPTPLDTAILVGVIVLLVGAFVSPLVFWLIPLWVQCPRCSTRIASVKISDRSLSPSRYEAAGSDRVYVGKHVCSVCWGALEELGFNNSGNWAPGAVVEYLKTTPNFIALFISVAALVLSTVALLR